LADIVAKVAEEIGLMGGSISDRAACCPRLCASVIAFYHFNNL
jgi:hypothetical protein